MNKKTLIIDTSSQHTFLAISQDGIIQKKHVIEEGKQLSKLLLPALQNLVDKENLNCIALGIGPGSFTGTRIGAVVAKTLSFALNIPIFTFPSTLLPDLHTIAAFSYEKSQKEAPDTQIELVYFSPTP